MTLVRALCTSGGIFGSLMVYILPALMRTAIAEQTLARLMVGARGGVASPLLGGSPRSDRTPLQLEPATFSDTVRALYRGRQHRLCGFMFTWGVASGLLSISVTALKQLGLL